MHNTGRPVWYAVWSASKLPPTITLFKVIELIYNAHDRTINCFRNTLIEDAK